MFGNREYQDLKIMSQRTENDLICKRSDQNCRQTCSMQSDLTLDVSQFAILPSPSPSINGAISSLFFILLQFFRATANFINRQEQGQRRRQGGRQGRFGT